MMMAVPAEGRRIDEGAVSDTGGAQRRLVVEAGAGQAEVAVDSPLFESESIETHHKQQQQQQQREEELGSVAAVQGAEQANDPAQELHSDASNDGSHSPLAPVNLHGALDAAAGEQASSHTLYHLMDHLTMTQMCFN